MTIPFVCIILALVLNMLTRIPVAIAMKKLGGYDNKTPRHQQAQLTGWGARALASHYNSMEAFAPFAAGVFVAHLTQAHATWASALAITFIVARVLFSIFYLLDWDKIRSFTWTVGFFATLGLFLLPIFPLN